MRRRTFIQATTSLGVASPAAVAAAVSSVGSPEKAGSETHGAWRDFDATTMINERALPLPEFVYAPTGGLAGQRNWHVFGNRRIQVFAGTDGGLGLFDESQGMRWLRYARPVGEDPHLAIHSREGASAWRQWGAQEFRTQTFGMQQVSRRYQCHGINLERTVLVPEGPHPWVAIRLRVTAAAGAQPQSLRVSERWPLEPRFLQTWQSAQSRDTAAGLVSYTVEHDPVQRRLSAAEVFSEGSGSMGEPRTLSIEVLGQTNAQCSVETGASWPTLMANSQLELQPGEQQDLWFRLGCLPSAKDGWVSNPQEAWFISQQRHRSLLVDGWSHWARADSAEQRRELLWHQGVLVGAANQDHVLGGHTLNQGSVYGFILGANAAARDQLQHALPLVHTDPDLALSVLRNTCAWASPDGNLPYALNGDKTPMTRLLQPSDQNLWAFWLAAEYLSATGDEQAFADSLAYHPIYNTQPVSLLDHLMVQFRYFQDGIGEGALGHVRMGNADWNDTVLEQSGVDRDAMSRGGSSVLNSAMASWVLGVFAPMLERLGEPSAARQALSLSNTYRHRVAAAWNGRWFDRAYTPKGAPIGRSDCWLEVQPWAILCGAASRDQAEQVLDYIDQHHRRNSPLGARVLWPIDPSSNPHMDRPGEGTQGGIWYSINMTLVWAAARYRPDMAKDEWQRMLLANHVRHYPAMWEGTLSGPDAWNAPEASRPGQTWATARFAMQDFPVSNLHSHSQPLLAYLRLQGIEPSTSGTLLTSRSELSARRNVLESDL